MTVPHRILMGPVESGMAIRDDSLSSRYINYFEASAAGPALIHRPSDMQPSARDLDLGHIHEPAIPDRVPEPEGNIDRRRCQARSLAKLIVAQRAEVKIQDTASDIDLARFC